MTCLSGGGLWVVGLRSASGPLLLGLTLWVVFEHGFSISAHVVSLQSTASTNPAPRARCRRRSSWRAKSWSWPRYWWWLFASSQSIEAHPSIWHVLARDPSWQPLSLRQDVSDVQDGLAGRIVAPQLIQLQCIVTSLFTLASTPFYFPFVKS